MQSDRMEQFLATQQRLGKDFSFDSWKRELEGDHGRSIRESAKIQSGQRAGEQEHDDAKPSQCQPAIDRLPAHEYPRSSRSPQSDNRNQGNRSSKLAKKWVGQKLLEVADAFEASQENRRRDSIYVYLSAVFRLVQHYRIRGRIKQLMHRAARFSGLSLPQNLEPFGFVIRCTSDPELVDDQLRSKYSRALRYYARFKKRQSLNAFARDRGGLNGLAARYTARLGSKARRGG
jgi:hypothetical protein